MNNQPKTGTYFKSWLLFWICSTITGLIAAIVAGGAAGAIIGALCAANGHREIIPQICGPAGSVFGFLAAGFCSFFFYRLTAAKLVKKAVEANNAPS